MDKVLEEPNTGCWLWKGFLEADGYGRFALPGRKIGAAHRVAWTLFKGDVPTGLFVCHKCDIRDCVNPDHLFLGTPAENHADMKRKGRSTRGAKNPRAKLQSAQVLEIHSLLAAGKTTAQIARYFGVSLGTIRSIRNGNRWGHLHACNSSFSREEPTMSDFQPAFDFVMNHEDPHRSGQVTEDAGGRTRFGIAQKFHPDLPEEFFSGPAKEALKEAEEIMRRDYWERMRLGEISSQNVANKLFDMAVNMGVHQAGVYAQRAVNGLIQSEAQPAFAADLLKEDGVVGDKSLAAINALEPIAYYQLLCDWSRQHYVHVASINPAQSTNLQGWLRRAAT